MLREIFKGLYLSWSTVIIIATVCAVCFWAYVYLAHTYNWPDPFLAIRTL